MDGTASVAWNVLRNRVGLWLTTREVANLVFKGEATQRQIASTRAALRRLEKAGKVRSQGLIIEWTTAESPPGRTNFENAVLMELRWP